MPPPKSNNNNNNNNSNNTTHTHTPRIWVSGAFAWAVPSGGKRKRRGVAAAVRFGCHLAVRKALQVSVQSNSRPNGTHLTMAPSGAVRLVTRRDRCCRRSVRVKSGNSSALKSPQYCQ